MPCKTMTCPSPAAIIQETSSTAVVELRAEHERVLGEMQRRHAVSQLLSGVNTVSSLHLLV